MAPWRQELQRLQPLEQELALLPVGWGSKCKGPMLVGWQRHPGFTVAQLQHYDGMRSVGARTGLLTGPLLCFDFDGASSLQLGLDPAAAGSWQVHRTTDANRLKVLFRPSLEQLGQLPAAAGSRPSCSEVAPSKSKHSSGPVSSPVRAPTERMS